MKTKKIVFGVDMRSAPTMGVLGHDGEYKPRFGLWLDRSAECTAAVRGILSEGFTCDVVLKLGCRCAAHESKPPRPIITLEHYAAVIMAGGDLEENCQSPTCYIREVFFPENVNLRRRSLRPAAEQWEQRQ